MATKKYLSLERLTEYDALIKAKMTEGDDSILESAKTYTNTKVADLVNSAPETLDTIGELATAFEENADMVEVLNEAITNKADKSDIVNPDWNQNDETADDYVKNRPFWTDDVSYFEIFNDSVEIIYSEYSLSESINFTSENVVFEAEKTYRIIINNVEYFCTAHYMSDDDFDNVFVGNGNIIMEDYYEDNGLPFCITTYAPEPGTANFLVRDVGIYELSIFEAQSVVHKIDNKYLPILVGSNVEGKSFIIWNPELEEEETVVADIGAEVFNNYEDNVATGYMSHAEGNETRAYGYISHAEGYNTDAFGDYSHSEGESTTASGYSSHSEGSNTTASGTCSHAEGERTTASGSYSHAEGEVTTASGIASHTEGERTIASGYAQHVQGKYNISDKTSAHIVGNGSSNKLSNAHTLDWNGNAWFAGDVYTGSTSGTNKDEGSKKLATEEYVDEQVASIPTPDVSAQITAHNEDVSAHSDIKALIDALEEEVDTHDSNTTKHITSDERTNWNAAKTIADEAYTLAEGKADSLSDLGVTATAAELNYVDGVTSNIQTQLDGKQNKSVWYGTCATAQGTTTKIVTTITGDFTLTTGNIVYVKFTHPSCNNVQLNVDDSGAISATSDEKTPIAEYQWNSTETVGFIYDGSYFRMIDGTKANTSVYGMTKLSSSTSSSSNTLAATASAVKSAYDLANTANTNAATAQARADEAYDLATSALVAITTAEIDEICGASIYAASEVTL